MVCERCRARDALHPQMFVFGTTGALCSECFGTLTRAFYEHHPEIMAQMPPGLTVDQLVEGQLRIMQATMSASDSSDPEQVIRKLKELPRIVTTQQAVKRY
jgi:DNA-binding transcriptional LysR family regulator